MRGRDGYHDGGVGMWKEGESVPPAPASNTLALMPSVNTQRYSTVHEGQ